MANVPTSSSTSRFLIVLGSLMLVVASLYWAQKVLIPIALALLLTFVLGPAVMALQRVGFRRVPAVILVTLLAFAVLGGFGAVVSLQLRSLANDLPRYRENIRTKIAGLRDMGEGTVLERVQTALRDISDEFLKPEEGGPKDENEPLLVRVEPPSYARFEAALAPAAEALATSGFVIVLVIFMLIQREDLRNRVVRLVGHGRLIVTTRAIDEAGQRISRYLLVQLVINAGFGLALSLGLFLLGAPYAFLWGFLAGTLRFVPYLGTWLAVGSLMLFNIAVFPGWTIPLSALALFLVLDLVTFNIVEPLLFGHSTGISPFALLLAAAFWTWLWGPVGLVLSTPITACLVVLGKYVRPLEFFSVLLGDEPALPTNLTYYQRLLAHDQDEATDLVEEYIQEHPVETVYDDILIPALVLAKRDREGDEFTAEDEQFLFRATRDIMDDLLLPEQQNQGAAAPASDLNDSETERPKVVVFGCPARDEADELALHMLRQQMHATGCRIEVQSADTLAAEVLDQLKEGDVAAVCIAALPPGGLAQARYLCKRLRAQFPELKIFVGRWGAGEEFDRMRERLMRDGADFVASTLLETRQQLLPLLPVFARAAEAV